ncbi:hypothetical protein GLOIN_2v1612854 [Rhizophagus clarus]|uniref:Uncharacterized protein n=1 Tax=Rhizophagus clarus TaxID=94130 RepID=A0A8H3MBY5_9GLOM|nr:hypothetical protein GLOIN_2v1612854 [Rhizophagus clarus]
MLIDIENSFPYERYDYVFEDIHSKDLHEQISKRLKIQYLSDSSLTEVKEVNGTFFGPHYRIIVSLPVKINQKRKNVHFVVDTVSPRTYICKEVYESFSTIASFSRSVLLNNIATVALLPPSDSHFTDINVLGTEYLKVTSANLTIDFENEHVSLRFINHEDDQINPHFISQLKFNVLNGMYIQVIQIRDS